MDVYPFRSRGVGRQQQVAAERSVVVFEVVGSILSGCVE